MSDLPSDTPRWTLPKHARMSNENLHISDFILVRKHGDSDSVLFLTAGEKFPLSFKRGKWLLPAAILDYGNIPNALFGGGPPPTSGTVSFKVVWSGVDERLNIKNTDPVYGGFAGEFVRNSAQMEWSAAVGDYTFVSDPIATSSSSFAEIGHERNGSFFP